MYARHCKECGKPFTAKRREAVFCSGPCRKANWNRRANWGITVIDLLMEWRFDRSTASKRRSWSHLCTHLGRFNDEDKAAGRRSWSSSARMAAVNSRVGR